MVSLSRLTKKEMSEWMRVREGAGMLGLNGCSRYVDCVINPVMILQISRPGLSLAAAAAAASICSRKTCLERRNLHLHAVSLHHIIYYILCAVS